MDIAQVNPMSRGAGMPGDGEDKVAERLAQRLGSDALYLSELLTVLPAVIEAGKFCEAVAEAKSAETTCKQDSSPVTRTSFAGLQDVRNKAH